MTSKNKNIDEILTSKFQGLLKVILNRNLRVLLKVCFLRYTKDKKFYDDVSFNYNDVY